MQRKSRMELKRASTMQVNDMNFLLQQIDNENNDGEGEDDDVHAYFDARGNEFVNLARELSESKL